MTNNLCFCAMSNSYTHNGSLDEAQEQSKRVAATAPQSGPIAAQGVTQAEVARRVGVSRPTVFAWTKRLQQGGLAALSNGVRGRPSRLDDAKREQLAQALIAGARAHGYATELWTLPRIAKLIEQRFGSHTVPAKSHVS